MTPDLLLIPWFKLEPWVIPTPFPEGGLKIQPFGVLVALGIIIGSQVAERRGEATGIPRQAVADFLVYTIVIGLLSAMLLNVAIYEPHKLVRMFHGEISYPGLSSYGGFFGGVMAALWFRHKKNMSIMWLGDVWCYAFPTAWLFGRSGCFVVHDHPGSVSDFFLAVDNYNLDGLPRHDLGLYEVLWSAVVIALFAWLGKKPRPRGFFMALLPILYAPIRFALDFLRETPAYGGDVRYLGLTPGHYWSVGFLVAGLAVAYLVRKAPQETLMLDGSPVQMTPTEEPSAGGAAPDPGGAAPGAAARARKRKKR